MAVVVGIVCEVISRQAQTGVQPSETYSANGHWWLGDFYLTLHSSAMAVHEFKPRRRNTTFTADGSWQLAAGSWQGILDVIPAASYTCDATGLITYFNSTAAAGVGKSR